jgi:hypothetical protein
MPEYGIGYSVGHQILVLGVIAPVVGSIVNPDGEALKLPVAPVICLLVEAVVNATAAKDFQYLLI